MAMPQSDAFVFFGATGDLAFKQIFPSLQALIRDEGLNVAIIGVAKSGWNLDQVRARAKDSLENFQSLPPSWWSSSDGHARETFGEIVSSLSSHVRKRISPDIYRHGFAGEGTGRVHGG